MSLEAGLFFEEMGDTPNLWPTRKHSGCKGLENRHFSNKMVPHSLHSARAKGPHISRPTLVLFLLVFANINFFSTKKTILTGPDKKKSCRSSSSTTVLEPRRSSSEIELFPTRLFVRRRPAVVFHNCMLTHRVMKMADITPYSISFTSN